MKKTVMVLVMVLTGLNVFAQNGVIREISGAVELKHSGASDFITAKIGDVIAQDTVISTGFKSNALVEVGSTVIALRPLTRLTLKEISASAGTETLSVNLQAGRVRVDVNPPAGEKASVTISSPSTTASVRGTTFYFDGRSVNVGSGVVDFSGSRGIPVPVPASSTSSVTDTGKPANSTYVYTPAGSSGELDSGLNSGTNGSTADSGDGGFMVGTMIGGSTGGMGGTGDGLIPQSPVGSDPPSGSAPVTGGINEPPPPAPPTPPPPPPPVTTDPPPVTRPPSGGGSGGGGGGGGGGGSITPDLPPSGGNGGGTTPNPPPSGGGGGTTPTPPSTGGVGIGIVYEDI